MTTATSTDPCRVECKTCSAAAGTWCRTASGAYTSPHAPRLDLAAVTSPPPALLDTAVYAP